MTDLRWPVELAGRGFNVSRLGNRFGRRSIPAQKAQQDTSSLPGEQSLNPADLWRRSFESWHRGAGQEWFDWEEGDKFRFDASWGVDPWTKKQLTLLSEVESKLASTATSVKLVVAGDYLYCIDGQVLKYTQDITASGLATWTTVADTPATPALDITSDGQTVWVAYGDYGLYATNAGDVGALLYNYIPTETVDYVKGRLMTSYNNEITNVLAANIGETPAIVGEADSSGGNDTDLVVTLPASSPGDLFIVAIGWSTDSAAGASYVPSGWTTTHWQVARDGADPAGINSRIFTKVSAGETSMTVTLPVGAQTWAATALSIENAYSVIPVEASDAFTAASTSHVAPSVDSPYYASLTFSALFTQNATALTFTAPAGMTLQAENESTTPHIHVGLATVFQLAPGATGTKTWTTSATADDSAVSTFVVAPHHESPLLAQPASGFTWIGHAEGQGHIYAAGYSGDKSLVYRTQIRADGTELDAPVVAATLPDGEIVRSIYGYLGIMFIGTDSGVRMAMPDANGDLTIGALINTSSPVRCFEGQERFVWFGLEDFDVSRWVGGSTAYDGLARLDLTQQVEQLVPAWTSDLMSLVSASTTETVQSVVTFQDRRVFSIGSTDGLSRGVYAETRVKVADGYLDSGFITYGISDTKVATYVDLRHKELVGTIDTHISTDEGAFTDLGTSTSNGSTLAVGPVRGDKFELRVGLYRASGTDEIGPTLTRLTLRSEPAPARGRIFQAPLIVAKRQKVAGREVTRDPSDDLAFIEALFDTQTLVAYREGDQTFQVFITDYEFIAEHRTEDGRDEQGILTVTLKSPGA